ILGETNYPEMGLINITNSNLNGVAHNPWNLLFNTGGSSGGATASVAANEVPIATGNDAGGSLRIPASWSGVIGLKPTQGLIVGDSTTPSVVNFADTRDITDTQTLLKGLTNPKQAQMLQKV
ncbi:cell wall anchor protein, partial [Pediococcus acidilactici]|nr:cell wall anchor protein [Pediococcus acidilactici]